MWQRRTFHECAAELLGISQDFRAAHTNRWGWDQARRDQVMRDTSTRGVEVLRILALSIRGDQDYGLTHAAPDTVGALRERTTASDAAAFVRSYRPPYSRLAGFAPLRLRQALNKVAHANPVRCGFFADDDTHDLVLTGDGRDGNWIAVVSLMELCSVIQTLPDSATRS